MFFGISTGASRRLRWGVLGLAIATAVVALSADPADARHRRKRFSYDPPYASIVVDANSGEVLQSTNADSPRHPASLTKIMTLYLLFEQLESGRLKLSTPLPVSAHAAAQPPTKLGLRPGQSIRVEDAILAMVTRSANDVAVIVAEAIGGTESDFARMMTRKARALGMRHTTYVNASGLPDSDQITTARDQALLGRAIQERFPRRYHYFSTEAFEFHGHSIRNHNRLLGHVEGVDGIKTGFTRDSGFNLVTSMWRGRRHLVAVVMGGRSAGRRDARMRELLSEYIEEASSRHTAPVVVAAQVRRDLQLTASAEPVPMPAARPEEDVADDATASVDPDATVTAFAATTAPRPGSTDPIKPLLVRTVSIAPTTASTATGAKFVALPSEAPASIATRPPQPITVADVSDDDAQTPEQHAPAGIAAENPVRGGWMIQVGAFGDEKEALVRLNAVQHRAKQLLGDAAPFTETVTKGQKTYYRARFAGLDKHRAEAACRALKRRDIACLTLKN
jgi:D-alanyl-D-alanine carboxypeptidase